MESTLKVDYAKYSYNAPAHKNGKHQEAGEIEYVAIDQIRPNPYQPRKNFNKTALMELAESIRAYGVLQPINVRKQSNGFYELVAGERRLRAAQIAGLKCIPCIPVVLNDNDSAVIALIENLQREDLNFIEEAEGYASLICEHGLTQENLARKIGKSQSAVANKIRLLRLSPMVRKIILDNNLTERHARSLLKIEDEQMQLRILREVCDNGLNVKRTEDLVERVKVGDEDAFARLQDDFDGGLNAALLPADAAGTGSGIASGAGAGKGRGVQGVARPQGQAPSASQPQVKRVIKDLRIFVNTIRESVEMLKESGVSAKAAQFDRGEYLEFIIRIPKKENSLG